MPAFLTLENISKYYTSAQSVVMGLHDVSLSFSLGEFVAVTGESGSGKSTLAKVMGGILPYESGEMSVDGKPTSHYGQSDWEQYRSHRISFISQSYDILPGCSVLENVVSALVLAGMDKAGAASRAEEILGQVELLDKKKRRAAKLSSGQKQRLSIARALAKPAPVLIADEPTGNLDGANSAKVIQLLAGAAKERLVIMVTHDFDEAKDLVTRHITVRDGMVESDVCLKAAQEEVAAPSVPKGKEKSLSFYTAKLQMASRPVWSAILFFFFALTAFAMFVFLGTFVVNLDDSFTRIYDDSAFLNGSGTRIVVARTDRGELTKEDWDALLAVPHVQRVERYGYVSDINYYYREGIDYSFHYEALVDSFGSPTGDVNVSLTFNDTGLFLQTVPYLPEGAHFLTAGRLPQTMYEVVAAGDEALIGTKFTFYIQNKKTWIVNSYIKLDATVVGVTDMGEHLYVSEQLGRVLTGEISMGVESIVAPVYEEPVRSPLLSQDVPFEGRFLCSVAMQDALIDRIRRDYISWGWGDLDEREAYFDKEFDFPKQSDPEGAVVLKPYGTHDSNYNGFFLVRPEDFEQIVPDTCGNVASLVISDYAYTDRVLDDIHALSYPAISPYRLGSTKQDPELAAQRLQTLKVCLLAFLAVFLLQILVLRAMFGMETQEYKLLANIGLRCRTAKRSVLWQMLLFTAGGQLFAFAAVFCGARAGVGRIVDIVKYLPAGNVLLFMLLHLATGLLTALWVQRCVGRQVYPGSLRYADLKMDEEEGEL